MSVRVLMPLAIAITLAGCAVPDFGMTKSSPVPTAAAPMAGPYDAGPVVLTYDGYAGPKCDFRLYARYPENIAPHTVAIRAVVSSRQTNFSNRSGFYVELPLFGVDWTEMTPSGVLTSLANDSANEPCEQLTATVEIRECQQGDCPQYVADEYSAISLVVK